MTSTPTKLRPIIFSGEMVRAILDGRKTQTRRVIEPQPPEEWSPDYFGMLQPLENGEPMEPDPKRDRFGACDLDGGMGYFCRYGGPGDGLWVRESFSVLGPNTIVYLDGSEATKHTDHPGCKRIHMKQSYYRGRSPIHMPRWASRITLPITSIRAERVQDITDEDAIAEGIECVRYPVEPKRGVPGLAPTFRHYLNPDFNGGRGVGPRHSYKTLWNSINANRGYGWDQNPWVWVIEWDGSGA